jgi:hypothetical protein
MINEEFDDEGSDETEDFARAEEIEVEEFERQEAEREAAKPVIRPAGSFARVFAGREIWFKQIPKAQLQGLRRFHQVMSTDLEKVMAAEESEDNDRKIAEIVNDFNDACFDLIDSLYLEDDDRRFVLKATVRGDLNPAEILTILFPARTEPDDDAEPVKAPVKKAKPARTGPKKTTANASRTRR